MKTANTYTFGSINKIVFKKDILISHFNCFTYQNKVHEHQLVLNNLISFPMFAFVAALTI